MGYAQSIELLQSGLEARYMICCQILLLDRKYVKFWPGKIIKNVYSIQFSYVVSEKKFNFLYILGTWNEWQENKQTEA